MLFSYIKHFQSVQYIVDKIFFGRRKNYSNSIQISNAACEL
jgi:hypothetical protein